MPNGLISILAATGIVAAAALLMALFMRGKVKWGWLMAGLGLMLVHDAAVTGAWGLAALPSLGENWNWTGKLTALALSLLIAALPMLGWKRSGLTLKQENMTASLVFSAVVAAIFLGLALYFPGQGGSPEDYAFQLTMPGLEEEIFYRGVQLLIFNEAFGRPIRIGGAQIGWAAVLISLAFGLDHAFGYGAQGFSFDPMTLALTGGPVLLLAWLREKSGSVVLPIVLHNFANTIFMLV